MAGSYGQPNLKQSISKLKEIPLRLTEESFEKLDHIIERKKMTQLEELKQSAEQAAHDIRTPLSVLLISLKICKNLSEKERSMFTDSIKKIKKIAQGFLESSKEEKKQEDQHILLSQALAEIVEQKELQYKGKNVEFEYSFDPSFRFTFIYGNALNFERMISNLINNSVEAFETKVGIIKVGFSIEADNVKITVEDNGKGMPPELVEKLIKRESVSTTKQGGFGIGTSQIQKTIREFKGKQFIESEQGVDTKITLTIPKSNEPKWIMKKVYLSKSDIIVILDDDILIHQKWKERLKKYIHKLSLNFFTDAQEAIDFINYYQDKDDIRLLTDYELIGQKLNGFDVVQKCGLGKYRASLISEAYSRKEVQDKAADLNVAVLPKALLDIVPIDIDGRIDNDMSFASADAIVIDDNGSFANSVSESLKVSGFIVDTYYDPKDLISNLSKYDTNIKIITDNCFAGSINGDSLVEHLYEKGFKNVCVFSGYEREDIESKYPSETEFLTKDFGDIEKIIRWCKS